MHLSPTGMEPGLISAWRFNEGAGQVVADSSPQANHGVLGHDSSPAGEYQDPEWFSTGAPLMPDCNGNGVMDSCDIADATSPDCNQNGRPDECELNDTTDCNENGVPDSCDIAASTSEDCNSNDIPDECETGGTTDCNTNGTPDLCDIYLGTSEDCNSDFIPDDCQPGGAQDCNNNGTSDFCDIYTETSPDCNDDTIPDECQLVGADCNATGVPDECELTLPFSSASPQLSPFGSSDHQSYVFSSLPDSVGPATFTFTALSAPSEYVDIGINDVLFFGSVLDGALLNCTAATDTLVIEQATWNAILLANQGVVNLSMRPSVFVGSNCPGSFVQVTLSYPTENDCNTNGIPDTCDIATGTSQDCNSNGRPDECGLDCNTNSVSDECDIFSGTSVDCNFNRIPDECEVPPIGTGSDCNSNGVPDDCETDCNGNGIPDPCDLRATLVSFSSANAYAAGDQPYAIASGDVNGDGVIDLMCVNDQDNTLAIFQGAGGGAFFPPSFMGLRLLPTGLVATDLDNDGDLDLAVSHSQTDAISIFQNNGDGTFAPRIDIFVAMAGNFRWITDGDYDTDGDLDLAVTFGNKVLLLINGGVVGGVWQGMSAGSQYLVGNEANSLVKIDVNNDGFLDIATANYSGTVSVILNLGLDGGGAWLGFGAAINTAAGSTPNAVAAGDFNSDGKADIACANRNSNNVTVLLNLGTDGGGTWQGWTTSTPIAVGTQPYFIAAADLNGDSKADIAVPNAGFGGAGRTVSVALNNGNGPGGWMGFATAIDYSTCWSPHGIVAVDLDGDSDRELAIVGRDYDEVWVLFNDGTGAFPMDNLILTGRDPYSVAVADINDDDHQDIVAINRPDNSLSASLNDGDAHFTTLPAVAVGLAPESVALADFDADGLPDAAVANYGNNNVSILRNLGNDGAGVWLGWATAQNYATGTSPLFVTTADLDNLNGPDIAVGYGNGVSVLLNTGTGAFSAATNYGLGALFPTSVAIGDFDEDGDADMAVGHSLFNNGNHIRLFFNNGNGTFGEPTLMSAIQNRYIVSKDLDLDGDIDLATAGGGSQVILNRGRDGQGQWLGFATPATYSFAGNSFWIHSEDLNGDGYPELVTTNLGEHTISVLINIGNGTYQLGGRWPVGNEPRSVTSGRLNGDGPIDLVIAALGSDVVAVLLNTSAGADSPDCNVNLLPDECDERGDFDGDGIVTIYDMPAFISAFTGGPCGVLADFNNDGQANGIDIQYFVNDLLGN